MSKKQKWVCSNCSEKWVVGLRKSGNVVVGVNNE